MNTPSLFSPLQIGPYQLAHRIVMAPLTRMRAEKLSFAPRPLNAEYYRQRATPGGLIIAEASPVMATGRGNPSTPGIYSEQQVNGWREVVDAVHAKGGLIFLQLWHSSFQPGGVLPVAPSAVPIAGMTTMTANGTPEPYETRVPSTPTKYPVSSKAFGKRRRTRCRPGSTASRSMAPMAI
jgi:N-ethylmaleimide reductase